jgi:hypothetical protein
MRNPKESYHLSDSKFISIGELENEDSLFTVATEWADYLIKYNMSNECRSILIDSCMDMLIQEGHIRKGIYIVEKIYIGPKDMKLAQQLIKAGSEHRKFMREIVVSMDITAPLFWFKEFDTYKVGTVANSTSTMHKLATTPITLDCFETDDYDKSILEDSKEIDNLIQFLENLRNKYLETKDKRYWKELIRWLPESWLQTRTVTMTYENLYAMCGRGQRRFHKLNEWSGIDNANLPNFISMARTLPYAKYLLFLDECEE